MHPIYNGTLESEKKWVKTLFNNLEPHVGLSVCINRNIVCNWERDETRLSIRQANDFNQHGPRIEFKYNAKSKQAPRGAVSRFKSFINKLFK